MRELDAVIRRILAAEMGLMQLSSTWSRPYDDPVVMRWSRNASSMDSFAGASRSERLR
jgi:hypothetical protein